MVVTLAYSASFWRELCSQEQYHYEARRSYCALICSQLVNRIPVLYAIASLKAKLLLFKGNKVSVYVFYSVVLSFPEVANSKSLQNASKIIILIFERRCAWYTVVSEVFFAFSSTESNTVIIIGKCLMALQSRIVVQTVSYEFVFREDTPQDSIWPLAQQEIVTRHW